jgi:hypothetical protein
MHIPFFRLKEKESFLCQKYGSFSDIQIPDKSGIFFYEFTSGFHLVAHQCGKGQIHL